MGTIILDRFHEYIEEEGIHTRTLHNLLEKQEMKEYIEKALEYGAKLVWEFENANGLNLIIKTEDNDGSVIYIYQGLYNNPKNNTFVFCEVGGCQMSGINRCKECAGIPIWCVNDIMKKARVCGKCGKTVESMRELNWVMYAGAECNECSGKSWEYINSKPSGYWTE